MERVTFKFVTLGSSIYKAMVKMCIVPDQNGTCAIFIFHFLTNIFEYFFKDFRLFMCDSQWVIWINTGELQGRLFQVGSREGLNAKEPGVFRLQNAIFIHADSDGSNFQDGICVFVKAAAFNIYDYYGNDDDDTSDFGARPFYPKNWVSQSYVSSYDEDDDTTDLERILEGRK